MADMDELALAAGGDGLEEELLELNEATDNGADHTADNGANDTSAANESVDGDTSMDDPELAAIKARVREMEEEANKLRQMQSEVDKQMNLGSPTTEPTTNPLNLSVEEKMEVDARSIYVGNVDYGAAAEELEQHFHGCGSVNRVTILCNKFDGSPKGFAYIEFADKDSVQTAMALDESLFRGRQIKVMPKRTNRPGISSSNRPPRGSRFRGRGRFGGFRGRRPRYRRSNFYSPY